MVNDPRIIQIMDEEEKKGSLPDPKEEAECSAGSSAQQPPLTAEQRIRAKAIVEKNQKWTEEYEAHRKKTGKKEPKRSGRASPGTQDWSESDSDGSKKPPSTSTRKKD